MSELLFVIKSFVAAVIVIICMQVQVGGVSLEQKAETWIHTSKFGSFLQAVADGAIRAAQDGERTLQVMFDSRHKKSKDKKTEDQ